ncbi:hypothetical protein NQ318_020638 [Aromia moschata]|uniref:Uncharacterized protein n=1 Tax=Aromia moschata TaxID=1265417 RepID=A0AAV8XDW7_9CUCU|nr:hypothetical protein NQ318_020638 [Aromia moschata]
MPTKSSVTSFVVIFLGTIIERCSTDDYTVPNILKLRFREASTMGIFVAISFPIDLPGREVYYSHFFEAIHALPSNETSYEYPPLIERTLDRQMVYNAMEKKISSNGYPGRACLLRTICEVGQSAVDEVNGVLGEIIHILLTPSSTINNDLPPEYEEAEIQGRNHDCAGYNQNCTVSFLDFVTWIQGKQQ